MKTPNNQSGVDGKSAGSWCSDATKKQPGVDRNAQGFKGKMPPAGKPGGRKLRSRGR